MNRQIQAPQDHTAGQLLSWEGSLRVVFLPPIIPVLHFCTQWLKYDGLSCADEIGQALSQDRDIRKERNDTL